MAWTTPRTWLAGEDPAASVYNTHIRDQFKAIGDAWTAYTPVWSSTGTNPAIGNGTITGAYIQAGKLVIWRFDIVSGTSTTYGTGNYRVSLPVTAAFAFSYPMGKLMCRQVSSFYSRTLMSTGSTTLVDATSESAVRWSQTNPFTPTAATAGQQWSGYGFYEGV